MLAGIGPLLGDSIIGRFGAEPSSQSWYYDAGLSGLRSEAGKIDTLAQVTVSPVMLRDAVPPLAILIDGGTGSSGEALAVAFRGRPNTRSFGSPTAGFATVNRGSRLADGANMVVTTGYYTDRRGFQYPDRLQPDSLVTGTYTGWPFPTDRVAEAAALWLRSQSTCASRSGAS